MIEMFHKKSKGSVSVHPGQVENMKVKGWTEEKPARNSTNKKPARNSTNK